MATLKSWLVGLAAFAAAFLGMLFYREKAAHEEDKRKAVEGARHTEQKANQALIDGLTHEQEEIDAAKNHRRRDHFDRAD